MLHREFDIKTVCMLVLQAIDNLAMLHEANLVHNHLCPAALCMGGSVSSTVPCVLRAVCAACAVPPVPHSTP